LDWARSTVRILDGCVSSLKFNLPRLVTSSGAGFSTATEIADSLVRITGMPFRTAHRIVGRIAASGTRPGLAELDEIALEIAGFRASERDFSEADLERALDPKSNVALRANTGGPAPAETERMVRERLVRIESGEERLSGRRSRVEKALGELRAERNS
jgi:argininosuccinate lyase